MALEISSAMFLQFYSLSVFLIDLINFFLLSSCEMFLNIFYMFYPRPKKSIQNEIVLVIGVNRRRIGHDIAINFSKLNASVICIDQDPMEVNYTMEKIVSTGGTGFGYVCNVTSKEEVCKTMQAIKAEVGNVSIYVHCCGIPNIETYFENPDIKTTFDLTILSHFWILNEILPVMQKTENGHIVLLTSVAGISAIKNQMPLMVGQFAVQGLFESLLDEFCKQKLETGNCKLKITLVHVYPFVINDKDSKFARIPNYFFGTMNTDLASKSVIDGVLKNEIEISIPSYSLWVGNFIKLLPRKITLRLRDFLDTGIDFV